MSEITLNPDRIGNFTSSEIYRLFESKKVCDTYIADKNVERRMGVSLKQEVYSRPMAWGAIIEAYLFSKEKYLGTSYVSMGDITVKHPTIEHWSG